MHATQEPNTHASASTRQVQSLVTTRSLWFTWGCHTQKQGIAVQPEPVVERFLPGLQSRGPDAQSSDEVQLA